MYKKHAKFFSRLNNLAGLGIVRPGLVKGDERERLSPEDSEQKPRKLRACPKCGIEFRSRRLNQHIVRVHNLRKCKHCDMLLAESQLKEHKEKLHSSKVR